MSTCIFTWFSEPLNHKRRFSTFLHNKTKETKEEEGIYTEYIPLVSNFYPRTFDLYTKIAISRPIFLSKEGEGPKEILTKHLSEVRVRSTEVVLFGSFLRICHCAKLMERLGLAALLCRGAFFARRRGRVSSLIILCCLFFYSFAFLDELPQAFFSSVEFLLFLPSTSKEKKEKLRIRRKWKMGFSIFFSLGLIPGY